MSNIIMGWCGDHTPHDWHRWESAYEQRYTCLGVRPTWDQEVLFDGD